VKDLDEMGKENHKCKHFIVLKNSDEPGTGQTH